MLLLAARCRPLLFLPEPRCLQNVFTATHLAPLLRQRDLGSSVFTVKEISRTSCSRAAKHGSANRRHWAAWATQGRRVWCQAPSRRIIHRPGMNIPLTHARPGCDAASSASIDSGVLNSDLSCTWARPIGWRHPSNSSIFSVGMAHAAT